MLKYIEIVSLLLIVIIFTNGCASMMNKKTIIKTEPKGAKVYVDGDYIGETPLNIDFSEKRFKQSVISREPNFFYSILGHSVDITKDGYATYSTQIGGISGFRTCIYEFICIVTIPLFLIDLISGECNGIEVKQSYNKFLDKGDRINSNVMQRDTF